MNMKVADHQSLPVVIRRF